LLTLALKSKVVSFSHVAYLDFPSNFRSERPLFSYTAFTYWYFYWQCTVLTLRHERNLLYQVD
jgi:hypothetical protein